MNYVIETELPDGIHWFGGVKTKSMVHPTKGLIQIPYNLWTPYKDEALIMDDFDKATQVKERILEEGRVIEISKAKFELSYFEYEKGVFLGPKRLKNIKIGESFKTDLTNGIEFTCSDIIDKKIICRREHGKGHRDKMVFFSTKSNKWVWVIYKTKKSFHNV